MAFPTRYSTRAYLEYEEIIEYVFNKFGAGTALKVDLYFEEVIDRINSHPSLFPYFDESKKYEGVLSVHKQHYFIVLPVSLLSW